MGRILRHWCLVLGLAIWPALGWAEITVAVASNFLGTAETLAEVFEAETGTEVRLVHGSTGRLFAQIVSGAPFDVFLSADADRPAQLLADDRATRIETYATGRLVLVGRILPAPDDLHGAFAGRRLVIANPEVAPYGLAAEEAARATGLDKGAALVIRVDSVGQAASVLVTGNADAAILAEAQLAHLPRGPWQSLSLEGTHAPIDQRMALVARSRADPAAVTFFEFMRGDLARRLIAADGYGVPE
jgi:molybdate transport system substrate-binding protein